MEPSFLIAAFIAGFLTALAPCQLPFLPVIIGGSVGGARRNSYIIIGSLLSSIVIFTFIIEGLASLFYVPNEVWAYISGSLVLFVGISFLFPSVWTRMPFISRFLHTSNTAIGARAARRGHVNDMVIGAALGPAFSSCSPTYLLILPILLSSAFLEGLLYLFAFLAGLGAVLLFVALLGQMAVRRLNIMADTRGWFKRIVGILIVLVGISILTGYNRVIEERLLDIEFLSTSHVETHIR